MSDGVRKVYAGKRGPIGNADQVPLAFVLSSAAAHLIDALNRLTRYSKSLNDRVPLDGVSTKAVMDIDNALQLLEIAGRHCETERSTREQEER